jgi:hypothetical protein
MKYSSKKRDEHCLCGRLIRVLCYSTDDYCNWVRIENTTLGAKMRKIMKTVLIGVCIGLIGLGLLCSVQNLVYSMGYTEYVEVGLIGKSDNEASVIRSKLEPVRRKSQIELLTNSLTNYGVYAIAFGIVISIFVNWLYQRLHKRLKK